MSGPLIPRLVARLALPVLLAACATHDGAVPADAPYLTGTITAAGGTPMTIRVEEIPGGLDSGGAKAAARIGPRTRILRGDRPVPASELRVGQRVSVWFEGPVAESYPVQGEAGTVSVQEPR